MHHIIASLSELDAWLVLLLVFLVSLIESLAFIGLVVPGVALLFALSALAGELHISALLLIGCAAIGAWTGDTLSFLLGRKGRNSRWVSRLSYRHADIMEKGEQYLQRWGWMALVVGRFAGPIRPIAPFVAGSFGYPLTLMMMISSISALPWALVYLGPGYLSTWNESVHWALQRISQASPLLGLNIALIASGVAVALSHHFSRRWFEDRQFHAFALIMAGALISVIPAPLILSVPLPTHALSTPNQGIVLAYVSWVIALLLWRKQWWSSLYYLGLLFISIDWLKAVPSLALLLAAFLVQLDILIHNLNPRIRSLLYGLTLPGVLAIFWLQGSALTSAEQLSFCAIFYGLYRLWQPMEQELAHPSLPQMIGIVLLNLLLIWALSR